MTTESHNGASTPTLDLTGLPEPVVQDIRRLVQTLRGKFSRQESGRPPGERPPLRGRFADLKLSVPKADIDEAQREAWAGFERELPEPGHS